MSSPEPHANPAEAPVLFDEVQAGAFRIGVATLNRPRQLNALNLAMCQQMLDRFRAWQSDLGVVAVVLRGAGDKGFCAGGDVAEVVRRIRAGGADRFVHGDAFFEVEYTLNALIHGYRKPFVSLSHGVNMGGGLGLSVGASHAVVAESSRLAMPEIHIGLFPDVGGGYFLNRVPGRIGVLMALTGMTLNEADALFAGLARFHLPRRGFDTLLTALQGLPWSGDMHADAASLTRLLASLCADHAASLPPSMLRLHFDELQRIALLPTPAEICAALALAARTEPWFQPLADSLAQGSPTAALVTFDYLRRAQTMSLTEVLQMDLRVARACQRRHDFPEGVRALLIDKDRIPRWQPARFEAVSPAEVAAHFDA